jgi:hypothetical protein
MSSMLKTGVKSHGVCIFLHHIYHHVNKSRGKAF